MNYFDGFPEWVPLRVENDSGDTMCIGIGNKEGYGFTDYISCDGCMAKHVEGENAGDDEFHL